MLSRDEREHRLHLPVVAEASAKKVNKAVDRLRVDKCPGRKRWIVYSSDADTYFQRL